MHLEHQSRNHSLKNYYQFKYPRTGLLGNIAPVQILRNLDGLVLLNKYMTDTSLTQFSYDSTSKTIKVWLFVWHSLSSFNECFKNSACNYRFRCICDVLNMTHRLPELESKCKEWFHDGWFYPCKTEVIALRS